jgi:hypothetical protein
MGLVLTIYSSINFVAMLWLECKIYQESKNDKPTDLYFILLIIFKILEKYNLQIIDIFTCFSIRARSIILLHLESLESSLSTIGENTELYRNIKKRFKRLTK